VASVGAFEPDLAKLERAALAGGGELDPTPSQLVDPGAESISARQALEHRPILLALLLFLLDLLVRRVRLFARKLATTP
jgi:hypothetical protein